jgi:hypothetical protein
MTKLRETDGLREIRRHVPAPIARGLTTLHRHNASLWQLEDRVRATAAATTIMKLKRAIDVANLARHAAVKQIDAAVLKQYKRSRAASDGDAVLDSSSVGQMLDRLSILVLKRARIGDNPTLLAQWAHAIACLDRAVAALTAGTWVHHAAGEIKQYG